MMKPTNYSLYAALLTISISSIGACGGSAKKTDTPILPASSSQTIEETAKVETPRIDPLPSIPSSPVTAPKELMIEVSLSNPNRQLLDVGLFMDAVYPGGGALLSAQMVLQQAETMVGVVGIAGLNLNEAFYVLLLDSEKTVLVAKVLDEEILLASLKGSRVAHLLHDGFVAVGSTEALSKVGPYALSNLIAQDILPDPTISLHMASILKGPKAIELKSAIIGEVGTRFGEILITAMEHMPMLRAALQSNEKEATLRIAAEVNGGQVQRFFGMQMPSTFSNLEKLGTGPWGLFLGGRLNLRLFAPLLHKIASETQIMSEIISQVSTLSGEMAMAVNYPKSPELRVAIDLQKANETKVVVDAIAQVLSKEKALVLGDFKAKLRRSAIKSKNGSLHELKLRPTKPAQVEILGKKAIFGYFGVVSDSLIGTFGLSAKKNARNLAMNTGNLKGKGSHIEAALGFSKIANDSFFVAIDFESLRGERGPKDIQPVFGGMGFTKNGAHGRIVVPASVVKRLLSGKNKQDAGTVQTQGVQK